MAAEAFAARAVAGVRAPPGLPEVLADSSLATPLLVVIEAYLEVHGGRRRPRTRSDLLEELLRHEDDYWKGGRGRRAGGPVLRRRVVALATLAGASSDGKAAERLRRVPDLTDASEERRRALARWADELYGGPLAFWNPVKPDLLAEHLVATTYHEHPEVLSGVLLNSPAARPVALYARAVPDHPQLAAALRPILTRELGRLCQLAIDQAATETDRKVILGDATLAAGLARWVTVTEVETNALIDAVDLMPPRSDLVVNPLAWCSPPCSPSDFGG